MKQMDVKAGLSQLTAHISALEQGSAGVESMKSLALLCMENPADEELTFMFVECCKFWRLLSLALAYVPLVGVPEPNRSRAPPPRGALT